MRTRRRRLGGMALLEALIAILIFALGVLGVASVQTYMLKAEATAQFRVEAAYLASDLLGRMWLDRGNIGSYACQSSSGCSYIKTEHPEWLEQLANLPKGSAEITVNASNVTISISWEASNDDAHRYVTSAAINS